MLSSRKEKEVRVIRCPSRSQVKLGAIVEAIAIVWPGEPFEVLGLPVELQDRPDLQVNAQPEGRKQTVNYAAARRHEMCHLFGEADALDISIESGAIRGYDVAVVALYWQGDERVILSEGVPFPDGALEEARRRGFKTTTAGDVIHERWPYAPSNDWQASFPPYLPRQQQIRDAVAQGLRDLSL